QFEASDEGSFSDFELLCDRWVFLFDVFEDASIDGERRPVQVQSDRDRVAEEVSHREVSVQRRLVGIAKERADPHLQFETRRTVQEFAADLWAVFKRSCLRHCKGRAEA